MVGRGPRRTAEELEAAYVEAYWLWCDNVPFSQIAEVLSGPYGCGSKATAIGWVERGREIEAKNGGPLSRRRAERERNAAAIRRIFVKIGEDMHAGRLSKERLGGYKAQLEALRDISRILALQAAGPPTKVAVTGSGGTPRELIETLLALPPDELQLPDREEDNR